MEAGRSLRELFAELSRTGADPAELLHAAGYGDVPEPLVAEAIVSYAGTAPLEVAEHLATFAVAHGPVPDPDAAPTSTHAGLSLLASAPVVDAGPAVDIAAPVDPDVHGPDPEVDAGHLADHVDLDPSALDDPAADPHAAHDQLHPTTVDQGPVHHGDLDPADLDAGPAHGPVGPPAHGSFGTGHDSEPVDADLDHRGAVDQHADAFLDHGHDVDVHGHDVSDHDPTVTAPESTAPLLDHDDHPDPTDLLDGDEPHHA